MCSFVFCVHVFVCFCQWHFNNNFLKIINKNLPPPWLSAITGDRKQVFFKSWPNITWVADHLVYGVFVRTLTAWEPQHWPKVPLCFASISQMKHGKHARGSPLMELKQCEWWACKATSKTNWPHTMKAQSPSTTAKWNQPTSHKSWRFWWSQTIELKELKAHQGNLMSTSKTLHKMKSLWIVLRLRTIMTESLVLPK